MKIITKQSLKKKAESQVGYWARSWKNRWDYIQIVAAELNDINPSKVLELGAYKINLTSVSDNLYQKVEFIDVDNLTNKKYIQKAQDLPWQIESKYYDVVIALQIFEHLDGNQQAVLTR